MRILLADDERLVRASIRSMIEELTQKGLIQQPLIEEAANGNELEEKLTSFSPHLAFVDIKMPGRSGLDVIEEVSRSSSRVSWVLLTGFAEFPYAKRAIELGVLEYLVKPASSEDLLKVIELSEQQGRERARTSSLIAMNKLSSIFRKTTSQEFDPWFSSRTFSGGVLVNLRDPGGEGMLSEDERSQVRDLHRRFASLLEAFSYEHYPEGIVAGQIISDAGNPVAALCTMEASRSESPHSCDALQVMIEDFLHDYSEWKWLSVSCDASAEEFADRILEEEQDAGKEISGTKDLPMNTNGHSAKRNEQVERALRLVHTEFTQEVGLAQIADELGLTPNYLSGEFKRYTGVNFTEYITKLRMDKAAELLKKPGMSVKQAAQELGYVSSRYFSKLFTQTYGVKPSDFIDSNR